MGATTIAEVGMSIAGVNRYYFEPAHETMPREQLAALQLKRLRATVRNAYDNVPFHRARLDAAFIEPNDLRSLDDIRRLPFTVKTDLRDHYPFGLFARPRESLARLHASSGTTGKPTVVGYTENDLRTWADLMARSFACAGARPGDLVHNAYGYGLFTGGLGAHYGAERLGATVVPMSGGSTERQIALIVDFGALEVGLFGAEPWSEAMRQEIEVRLGLTAVDIYGLSEIMGPGVACECEHRCGLHGWEDHFLFEIIDPESNAPVPEGHAGELVITTLTKEALPMLRYRTRDITRLTRAPCDCGRTHLRILRITGRTDDMLIIRGVNVYPSQVEAVLIGAAHIAPHYQLVVERRGSLDHMTVEVEVRHGVGPDAFEAIARDVAHSIKSLIGITTDVVVKKPDAIPRSQGKAVRVRDLRPKE